VFDLTNEMSFRHLDTWRDEFLIQASPKDAENFPFILLGNKLDAAEEASSRQVSLRKAVHWCESKGSMPYLETSAKDSTNVEDAFQKVASRALQKENENVDSIITNAPPIRLQDTQEQKKGCC
jgi:Ras-related protein Rab-7A